MLKMIIIIILIFMFQTAAYSQSLVEVYQASVKNYPAFKSFNQQKLAIENTIKAFKGQRLLDLKGGLDTTIEFGQSANLSVNISNTFDLFNKAKFDIKKSEYDFLINYYSQNLERKNLFLSIANEYFNLQKNYSLLKIHNEFLNFVDKNINILEIGIKGGLYPASDIDRWNVERLTKLNLIESDNLEIQKSIQAIKLLSGLNNIIVEDLKEDTYQKISVNNIISNSPELYFFNIDKLKLSVDIQKEENGWYPTLQVTNTYQKNGQPYSSGGTTSNNNSSSSGSLSNTNTFAGSLSFNIFDGGRAYRIEAIKNKINSLDFDKRSQEIILVSNFNKQVVAIQNQHKILDNLKKSVIISENNLNKMLIGYKRNFIDLTTIINLNRDLLTIKESYINTLVNINQNYQTLYHLASGDIYE